MPETKDILLFSSDTRDIIKDLSHTYLQDKDLIGFCEAVYQAYPSHDKPIPKEAFDRFRYFLEDGLSLSQLSGNPTSFADFSEAVQGIDWEDPVIRAKIDTWMNSAVDVAKADPDIENDLLFTSMSDIPDQMQRHGIRYEQDFLFFNRRDGKSVVVNGEETGAWDMVDHLGYPDTVRIRYEDGKPYLRATAICVGDEEETSYYLIPSDRLQEASKELPETQEAIQAYEKEHPEVNPEKAQEAVADVDFSGIRLDALQKYIQHPYEVNGSDLDLGSFQFHSLHFVATVEYADDWITPGIHIDLYRPAMTAEEAVEYGAYLEGDTEHQFPYILTDNYAFVGIDVASNKEDIYREMASRAKELAREEELYQQAFFTKMPDPLKGTYSSVFSQELYEKIQKELQTVGETRPNENFFTEGDTLYTVEAWREPGTETDNYSIDVHLHGATALKEHQPIPLPVDTMGFLSVPRGTSYPTFLFMGQGRMEPEQLDQVRMHFTSDRSPKDSFGHHIAPRTWVSLESVMQPYSEDALSPEILADVKKNLRENMESGEMDWSDDETECSAKFSCFTINPVSCSEGVFFRIAFQTEDAKDQESLISTNDREPCVLDSDIVATKEEFLAMDFDTFKQKMRETASSYFDSCKFPVASENSIREVVFPPYVKEQEKKETMTIQQAAEQFAASAATYQSALMDSGMTRTEANKGMMAILREVNEKSKAQGIEH